MADHFRALLKDARARDIQFQPLGQLLPADPAGHGADDHAEEPGRNRSDDEGEKSREPQGINAQPRATGEGDPSRRGERTDAADSRAATASIPAARGSRPRCW